MDYPAGVIQMGNIRLKAKTPSERFVIVSCWGVKKFCGGNDLWRPGKQDHMVPIGGDYH